MKFRYKNIGTTSKSFYGVKFNPGETKEVEGYINANSFIRVDRNDSNSARDSKVEVKSNPQPNKVDPKPDPKPEPKPDPKPDPKKGPDKPDTPSEHK